MDPILNPFSTSAASTILVPFLLQYAKRFFPQLTPDAMNLVMRALQMLAAIATSVGVRYQFDVDAGRLVVEGLTLATMLTFTLQVAAQYKSFEVIYRAAIKPPKAQ